MTKQGVKLVALAVLAVALGSAGYWLQFTTFMIYDDEGYVLLSLKNYSEGGGLYDRVYTQYGPFPYVWWDLWHRLTGLTFDNVTGRWMSLISWLGVALACAGLVWRTTRSALWSAFTLAGTFSYLWVMINEPAHPGGLIALMIATGTWLGAETWRSGQTERFAAIGAVIGTALLLTKINVGVFYAGAVFTWLTINGRAAGTTRILTWLIALGCAVLPFLLMRSLFEAPWVRLFALLFTGSALALLLTARTAAQPVVTTRSWLLWGGVTLLVFVMICAVVLVRGTSPAALVAGVLLDPLKHPGVYYFAMNWRMGSGVLALVCLAGAIVWACCGVRARAPAWITLVACVRLVVAGIFCGTLLQIIPTSQAAWGMSYGLSLAWLLVIPLGENRVAAQTRAWVAFVLLFQFLHAYPVAGSQLNWGTFLWVTLLALGLHDAAPVLVGHLKSITAHRWRLAGAAAVASVTLFCSTRFVSLGWTRYSESEPLGLRGAETLRLPHDFTHALRIVDKNLALHGDVLFSLPGQFSANLRTGLPTPTPVNVTHWFSLLNETQQQAIIARLEQAERPLLLVQRESLDYLEEHGFAVDGPLHRWLMATFERSFAVDGYEVWVRRGRALAPLDTARLSLLEDDLARPALTIYRRSETESIARIELCDVSRPDQPLLTLDANNTRIAITPVGLDGQPIGAIRNATFPLFLDGLARVELQLPPIYVQGGWSRLLLRLRDASGSELGRARVIP